MVTEKFAGIDLHPETVGIEQMGHVFEELIRKFAELSNETAGEYFTPREVIRLMVNLLFIEDDDARRMLLSITEAVCSNRQIQRDPRRGRSGTQ